MFVKNLINMWPIPGTYISILFLNISTRLAFNKHNGLAKKGTGVVTQLSLVHLMMHKVMGLKFG